MIASELMTSTTEDAKRYRIRFKDGNITDVVADTVNVPTGTGNFEKNKFFLFELNGDVAAKSNMQTCPAGREFYQLAAPGSNLFNPAPSLALRRSAATARLWLHPLHFHRVSVLPPGPPIPPPFKRER